MKIFTRLIVTAFALLLVAEFMPGFTVTGIFPALFAALLLGICNALVRPLLILLTLPITILTLGLFIFFINASIFLLVAFFVPGFDVANFWIALFGSIIVSIVSGIVNKFV